MKLQRYELFKNLLAVLLNYLVVLSAWHACEAVFYTENGWVVKLTVGLVPYLLYAVRTTVKKLWSYLLLHVAVTAAFVYVVVLMCKKPAVPIIAVICCCAFSFSIRFRSQDTKEEALNPIGTFAIMLISFLAADYLGVDKAITVITKLALSYAVIYIPYMYICRFLWFDFMNRKTITKMPSERLFKAGFLLTTGMSVSALAVLLALLDEQKLIELGRKIRNLLRRFLRFLLSGLKFENSDVEDSVVTANQGGMDFSELMEDTPPSPFMLWLEKVVMIAATIIGVLGIIFLIVAVVVSLIRRFKGLSVKHTEEVSEDITEVRERIVVKERKRLKKERLSLTPSDRIRRMYFKLAKENTQYTLNPEKYTVREFAEFFEADKQISALEFCKLYEKARYSEETVTAADVRNAKNYYRQLSE